MFGCLMSWMNSFVKQLLLEIIPLFLCWEKGGLLSRLRPIQYKWYLIFSYFPDLKTNLVNVGPLQEKDYVIIIIPKECRITDLKHSLTVKVKMTPNGMFSWYLINIRQSCFATKVKDAACLWHFWFGHLNFWGL